MTTTPEQPTAIGVLDAETARQALNEMAAVVRTIFGVNLHNTAAPAQQHQEPEVYEDIPPSFDPAPEHDLNTSQTAALTSVPAPAAVPVPVAEATVMSPALVAPDALDPTPATQPVSPSPAANAPVPAIAIPSVQVPGIAIPGLAVPPAAPSAELLHGDQQLVDHQYVDGPTVQANEAGEDDQDEASLPPEYATTPDRHSMALLHEIAFLDD